MNKKQVIKINENALKQIVRESVKRVLKEDFEGEDTFEQIDNMQFTQAEKQILDFAFSLVNEGFSDEDYFNLAYYFAQNNGLN